METAKIDQLIALNALKLPQVGLEALKTKLAEADETKAQMAFANLKNPTGMFWLSFFLGCFGVDRFMLGKTGSGVVKLITCGGCDIWWLIDLFKVKGMTRDKNLETILENL